MADSNDKANEKSKSAPKLPDRYLNTVFGNVLDEAVNTSYNLKLYMIKDRTSDGGGYMNSAVAAKPEETVVIAQTGVTGVQMDGLTIDFVKDKGNHFATAANFTLIQPGAADLLDQLQAAKVHLGIEAGMYANAPIFLEINFKGYEASLEEEDQKGAPKHVSGPFIYKLEIAKISIAIDDKGSEYEVMCTVGNSEARVDNHFLIPMDTSVSGATITEMAQELEDNINRFREENLTDHDVQDEIKFDLSQLLEGLKGDDTVVYDKATMKAAEDVNRLMNAEAMGITTLEDYEKSLEDDPDSLDGGVDVNRRIFANNRINFKEGTDINRFFTTLLVMNKNFLDSVHRKKIPDDPDVSVNNYDLAKAYTSWYKIEAEMEYLDYDQSRSKYAKRVTYQPIIYSTSNPLQTTAAVEQTPEKEDIKNRVKEMNASKNLLKAYHYLYTGLNDQIMNVDIKFDAGMVLLLPPGGGKMGDMSTNPNSPSANVEANKDLTGEEEKAQLQAKQKDVSGISKALKEDPNLRQRLKDKGVATQEDLDRFDSDEKLRGDFAKTALYLANNGKDPLGFKDSLAQDTEKTTPTESGSQTNTGGGGKVYKPEPSGFLYASDILTDKGGMPAVIGENQTLTQLRKAANTASGDPQDTSPIMQTESGKSLTTEGSATSDGTNSATLFGYMFNNVQDAAILQVMDLGLKGDPWYLGEPFNSIEDARKGKKITTAKDKAVSSNPEGAVYDFDDNYFLFTMQTPRVRDPHVDDEDKNTGYMSEEGTSFFISGVYMISRVTATFNGGQFTCDVKGHKQTPISIAHLMDDISQQGGDELEEQKKTEKLAQQDIANQEENNRTNTESGNEATKDRTVAKGTNVTEVVNPDGSITTTEVTPGGVTKIITRKSTSFTISGLRDSKQKPKSVPADDGDDF
tara:strand:+ start:12277 stop:15012 length:2736 start_codon:yes stop_codon:yes gene_type:complete